MARIRCLVLVIVALIEICSSKYYIRYDEPEPDFYDQALSLPSPMPNPRHIKPAPRKRFFGLDIPDYVTDDDRPKHVQDIIKRLKEKHYL